MHFRLIEGHATQITHLGAGILVCLVGIPSGNKNLRREALRTSAGQFRLVILSPAWRTKNLSAFVRAGQDLARAIVAQTSRVGRGYAGPGIVKGMPFFAKIIARSFAGSVALALLETSCVLPGGSKNISPVRYVFSSCPEILVTMAPAST